MRSSIAGCIFRNLEPRRHAKSARGRSQTPQRTQKPTRKQAGYLHLRACQLHAAQYYEPRAGHGAHVQSRTSLFSLPARCVVCANACDSRGHGDRNSRVHGMRTGRAGARYQLPCGCAAHAPSQFEVIPGDDMLWRLSRSSGSSLSSSQSSGPDRSRASFHTQRSRCVSAQDIPHATCARRAQHQRAHALGVAPPIARANQRASAHFLLHAGWGP